MNFSNDKRQDDFLLSLGNRLIERGYTVEKKTPYHFRINGRLDCYPVNRLWHDVKENKRGTYQDIFAFVTKFFNSSAIKMM